MNWEAIGAIGEVCGAIAVVATLAYLAKQVRLNTVQARVQTDALEGSAKNDFLTLIAGDESLSRIARRGTLGEQLDEEEAYRFNLLMYLNLANIENFYRQYEAGTMTPRQWKRWDALLDWYAEQPGFQRWWRENTVPEGSTIERLVESRLTETPGR